MLNASNVRVAKAVLSVPLDPCPVLQRMVFHVYPTVIVFLLFAVVSNVVVVQKGNRKVAHLARQLVVVVYVVMDFIYPTINVSRVPVASIGHQSVAYPVRAGKQVCQNLLVSRIVVHPVVGAVLLAMNAQVDRA